MGDDDNDEICNTKLGLGIGLDDFETKRDDQKSKCKPTTCLDLSLIPLHPMDKRRITLYDNNNDKKSDEDSGSIGSEPKTKEKEESHNNFGFIRKKLRLTTYQSTILEDTFRHQTTLTTAQKQALAQKLNLNPRQVEVWFQNRRARTKLKQTEVDCEYLRKRCENLSDENRRLKKELQELRLLKKDNISNPPLYVQLQKAANYKKTIANICQYCEDFRRRSSVKINAGGVKIEPLGATETSRVLDAVHDHSNIINGKQKQKIGHGFNLNIPEVERERES